MPSRGSYRIANAEEGIAAQRDQSYKNCVLTLLIIFFLCMILILATSPWKILYNSSEERGNYEGTQDRYHKHLTKDTRFTKPIKYHATTTISSVDERISEEIETTNSVASNKDSSKSAKLLTKTKTTTINRPISSATSKRLDNYSTINASSFAGNETTSTLTTGKYEKYTETSTISATTTDRISMNGSTTDGTITSGNATTEIAIDESTAAGSISEGDITTGSITAESFTGETINRNNANGSTTEASIFTKLSSITQLDTKITTKNEEITTIEVTTESPFNSAMKSEENNMIETTTESSSNSTTKGEENTITEVTIESPFDSTTKNLENTITEVTTESPFNSTTKSEENTITEVTIESLFNSTTKSEENNMIKATTESPPSSTTISEENNMIEATTENSLNSTTINEENTTIKATTESPFNSTTKGEENTITDVTTESLFNSTTKSEENNMIETTTKSPFNSTTKGEENTITELTTESVFNSRTKGQENTITEITTDSLSNSTTKGEENTITEVTTESPPNSTTRSEENTTIEATTERPPNSTTRSHRELRSERNATIKATTASTFNSTIRSEENTTIQATTESSSSSTTAHTIEKNTCTTGKCKNLASKMVFYMDHSVDPCDDFYEYSCGRFEADPATTELDLKDVAYRRMLRQIEKENGKNVTPLLIKYYNSCMQYENVNQTERIKLAKKMLDEVGKFYTTETWVGNQSMTNFTELLAQLLLHNSALLFDVTPDLNETSPKLFTFKIGPTTYPFDTDETNDPCYASQNERETEALDLEQLYTEYKSCKKNMTAFINSISEAMIALNLHHLYNQTDLLPVLIDNMIVQQIFKNLSPKSEIRKGYLMKNYKRVTIFELARDFKVVNWTKLICLLTKEHIVEDISVQVYFYEDLAKLLKHLEELNDDDPMHLHNALLGLYARNLYHELVLSKHQDAKKHCISEAARLLVPEVSNLYISSFSKDELTYMSESIRSLFEELKETLKLKIGEVEWATEEGRNAMIAKINDLKVAVPDISYLTDSYSTYKIKQADMVNLTDNYIENSMILMRRFRNLMYTEFLKNPNHPEQIWTHYATPYQSKALAIYGLNLVVIPFGAIDWSIKYDNSSFDYIKLATLGNVIAHQIAHHFDANGIYYWNGTRNAKKSLLNDNYTNTNFEEYIENQRNMYERPMNMILPSTGQNVTYKISQLTLNERLSEATGLRLAYDTLDRLRSSKEVLPWLELNYNQLFYLTYAQMHCTKSPLTSSYISLYENEQLPSRIRIFVSASNNKLLGETWKCPDGSRIMPSYTYDVFPYLKEATNDYYDS